MPRDTVEPTVNERGDEQHPAFGMISASRVSSTPPASLFDSEIQHNHFVTIRIGGASRQRGLNRDWIHPEKDYIEIAMSEAQWAQFVSSLNSQGTACTIERHGHEAVPGIPYAPRLERSMDEVRGAGDKALAHIREAFEKVKEKPNKGNIRSLESAINNAPANMRYAAESLTEHAENTVQKARADIEAMATLAAEQAGLSGGEVQLPALEAGERKGHE